MWICGDILIGNFPKIDDWFAKPWLQLELFRNNFISHITTALMGPENNEAKVEARECEAENEAKELLRGRGQKV